MNEMGLCPREGLILVGEGFKKQTIPLQSREGSVRGLEHGKECGNQVM